MALLIGMVALGPLAVLLVPFWTGVISGGAFMVVGHVLILPAMAAAMLLRRDDTGSS